MYAELQQLVGGVFFNWVAVVSELTADEKEITSWARDFNCAIRETLMKLMGDIQNLHRKVLTEVEQALKDMETVCKSLMIQIPPVGKEKLALNQEYKKLQEHNQKLKKLLEQRKEEISRLYEEYIDLCTSLGRAPLFKKELLLPSPKDIEELKNHIKVLEDEKSKRLKRYKEVRETISEIAAELQYQPSTSFEQDVLSNAELLTTSENMTELQRFLLKLQDQQFNLREEVLSSWNKLKDIWNRLDIELTDQQKFQEANKGCSVAILNNIRLEISRCEELRKLHYEEHVQKLRKELSGLWEICHCNQDQEEEKFQAVSTVDYPDKIHEILEEEINKWNSYYEENKELLKLLKKHKEMWSRMMEIHNKSTDPRRLQNRGGQLLKDEKARTKLRKEIPMIGDNIKILARKYEQTHHKPFMTFGVTVHEYLQKLEEPWEIEKKQKTSALKATSSKESLSTPQTSNVPSTKCVSARPKFKSPGISAPSCSNTKVSPKTDPKKVNAKIVLSTMESTKRRSIESREIIERKRLKKLKFYRERPNIEKDASKDKPN